MSHIQSPAQLPERLDLFLAGGITNCPLWQDAAADYLADTGLVLVNPRRQFGIDWEGPEAREQIGWEHDALSRARGVLFWFPETSICPIALFELGVQIGRAKIPVTVGAHPDYPRLFDLRTQMDLAASEAPLLNQAIFTDLFELCDVAARSVGGSR